MCNLYAIMRARAAIAALARAMSDRNNNQPPLPAVFPDYAGPVVINGADGQREMVDMRWGLPSSQFALKQAAEKRATAMRAKGKEVDFAQLLRMEPDRGTTNVRNTDSKHWTRWLGPSNRCLVPFTSFCEPDQVGGSRANIWFALSEGRPLAFFAGVHVPGWTSVRKVSEGEVTADLYGFLTTTANADVGAFHDKAMPVILTEPAEWDLWLSGAPWDEVKHLQRPLPNGALKVVGRDTKKDEAIPA